MYPEIMKLFYDEEVEVKAEAIALYIDLIDMYPYEFTMQNVIPVVMNDILTIDIISLWVVVAEKIGVLVIKLEAELQDPTFFTKILEYI